jgi:hypothetical protein
MIRKSGYRFSEKIMLQMKRPASRRPFFVWAKLVFQTDLRLKIASGLLARARRERVWDPYDARTPIGAGILLAERLNVKRLCADHAQTISRSAMTIHPSNNRGDVGCAIVEHFLARESPSTIRVW